MRGISGRSAIRRSKRRVSCVTFNLNSSKPSLLRCFLSCAPGFQSAVLPLPSLFSICHSAAVLAPALPPGTIRPRIPALPHLFSLSSLLRSRRGPSDPVSPRFRTSSLCPASALPPGPSDPASPRFHTSSLCPAFALPPGPSGSPALPLPPRKNPPRNSGADFSWAELRPHRARPFAFVVFVASAAECYCSSPDRFSAESIGSGLSPTSMRFSSETPSER